MKLNDTQIAALEKKGFKRWQKAGMDRLYINSTHCGLELEFYNTGNIRHAEFNGETISNSNGYRYRDAKNYIDVEDGSIHTPLDLIRENIQKALDEVLDA